MRVQDVQMRVCESHGDRGDPDSRFLANHESLSFRFGASTGCLFAIDLNTSAGLRRKDRRLMIKVVQDLQPYFLKSLQDKPFDMKNGIVVIDDPVSSLDANALFSSFGYMKERTKQAGQLFIFTHSFPFFRLVKNWFHHLPKQKSPQVERRPGRFFLLRSRRHTDGSRTCVLGHLDPLLEEHESEYQYLFRRVYDEAHRNDVVQLEHHYGLPNVARRLIETFLAFRFPEMSGDLGPRLDRVAFDNAKKTRILRLLNTYSHAGAIADPEHDLSLLSETQPVLLDVLELMKAVDKQHYEGLEKLVAPEGAAA